MLQARPLWNSGSAVHRKPVPRSEGHSAASVTSRQRAPLELKANRNGMVVARQNSSTITSAAAARVRKSKSFHDLTPPRTPPPPHSGLATDNNLFPILLYMKTIRTDSQRNH